MPVDDDLAFSESEKPRYLLPEGCKDLYDVIRRDERAAVIEEQRAAIYDELKKDPGLPIFKFPDYITIPDPVNVADLAEMLTLKTYQLIAILLTLDVFSSATAEVSFATAGDACALLGVEVKRANAS